MDGRRLFRELAAALIFKAIALGALAFFLSGGDRRAAVGAVAVKDHIFTSHPASQGSVYSGEGK